mmetsp:Transcript_5463/g.9296  ORF Transcript_5463/g.9296 Transcript_5463/m.9296 type:complete len:222 (-) Transcript_5463:270-935(-)
MNYPSRCHVSDISHKAASSTHVYMYRSMMWYKRGKGGEGSQLKHPNRRDVTKQAKGQNAMRMPGDLSVVLHAACCYFSVVFADAPPVVSSRAPVEQKKGRITATELLYASAITSVVTSAVASSACTGRAPVVILMPTSFSSADTFTTSHQTSGPKNTLYLATRSGSTHSRYAVSRLWNTHVMLSSPPSALAYSMYFICGYALPGSTSPSAFTVVSRCASSP